MTEEDLEAFVVYRGAESIAPTLANEGTNASRFAIAGTLTALAPVAFDDSRPLVGADNLERFGFNTNFSRPERDSIAPFEAVYDEAIAFIERRDNWSNDEGRFQAWSDLRERAIYALVSGFWQQESPATWNASRRPPQ